MRFRKVRGFTLIELLVTLAIIGVLSAIAVMSYLNVITKARQRRTMADMRTIAQAWESRAADAQTYLVAGAGFTFPTPVYGYGTLAGALSPTYVRQLPQFDGWNGAFQYSATANGVYGIRSAGSDGVFEGDDYTPGISEDADCDIVFSNGNFVVYPDVPQ